MQIEYKSDWIRPTIELMKCLGYISKPIINEDMGSVDYYIDDKSGKRLIRAMVNGNNRSAPTYVDTIRAAIEELEIQKYDEIIILSKRITNSAHEIVAELENLNVITPNTKHNFSLIEVVSAIQKKTRDLCKIKCAKVPETKDDCKGKNGRNYVCDICRVSDDATFHATMKWKKMLLEDFNNLCEIEKEMETSLEVN